MSTPELRKRVVRQIRVARLLGDLAAIAILEGRLRTLSSGAHV